MNERCRRLHPIQKSLGLRGVEVLGSMAGLFIFVCDCGLVWAQCWGEGTAWLASYYTWENQNRQS